MSVTAELCNPSEIHRTDHVLCLSGEVKPVYAYCLFCETQRCRLIAEYISTNYGHGCISPQIIQRKWVKGIPTEENHDWLPGYVFLYTEEPVQPHFDISGIIRCLGNGELKGQDLAFAEMIYKQNGIIGNIPLIREGELCRINDPAWEEMQGRIIRMDHGRKRCCVEFEFDGARQTVWAGYEITVSTGTGEQANG